MNIKHILYASLCFVINAYSMDKSGFDYEAHLLAPVMAYHIQNRLPWPQAVDQCEQDLVASGLEIENQEEQKNYFDNLNNLRSSGSWKNVVTRETSARKASECILDQTTPSYEQMHQAGLKTSPKKEHCPTPKTSPIKSAKPNNSAPKKSHVARALTFDDID